MSSIVERGRPVFTHGAIPDGWTKARIGDICQIVRGVTYKKNQASEQPAEGKVPILRATNIQNSALVLDRDLVCVPSELVSDIQKLRVGDIVVATSSGSKHLVGKTAQVIGSWEGSFGAFCAAIRPKTDIDHRYLGYFFNSRQYKDYISAKSLGVNINNLRRGDFEEISVPLAPKALQQRIVAEIEKQFSRLDEAVANLKRVKANLKRYKASVLKAAIEGKLTEDWRKQHPNVEPASQLLERILVERRTNWTGRGKYKPPIAPDTNDLPSLPKGWTWATVDQLAAPEPNSITDGPFGSNLKTEHYKATGPRVIRLQNIGEGVFVNEEAHISEEHFVRLRKHRIFAGDLVIAALGEDPPRSCLIPQAVGKAIVKADCIRFRPHKHAIARYLNGALNSEPTRHRTKAIVHGVGRPRLNLGEIKTIVVPIPPTVEQQAIVAEIERRLSVIEELEATAEANLTRADRLRQSVLQRAFAGKLVPQGPIELVNCPSGSNLKVASHCHSAMEKY